MYQVGVPQGVPAASVRQNELRVAQLPCRRILLFSAPRVLAQDFNPAAVLGQCGQIAVKVTEIDKYAIEGPQLFPEDMVSDQPERQLVAEIIREKMLRLLDREGPHGVAVGIERWNEREDGLVEINAVIYCEKASHKGIIIGKRGAMLKEIGQQARADIERMLDAKVFLELWVKVKEGWRNNQYQMRNFGYEEQ